MSDPAQDPVPEEEVVDVLENEDVAAAAEALEVDLELLLAEREQYLDAYRRAQADFENFKKRVTKQQHEAVDRGVGGFVERFLPVLDACDGALSHGASEVEPIFTTLLQTLEKEGLERLDPAGEPFDPNHHEAVMHEPGDGDDGPVVVEVMRPGYVWKGRLLRPAMVKVRG